MIAGHFTSWSTQLQQPCIWCEQTCILRVHVGCTYILVGGLEPWNFMTFHSVGNGTTSSQLTNSVHHFSEGFWLVYHQAVLLSHQYPIIIHIKPYKTILKPYIWNHLHIPWGISFMLGGAPATKKGACFLVRWDPIATLPWVTAWRTCHWLWEHHYPPWSRDW